MRPLRPFVLVAPKLLIRGLKKHLEDSPPAFKYDFLYFCYIIDLIVRWENRLKDKEDEFVNLNLGKIKKATIYNISGYIKFLENGGFIITDNKYIPGEKSKGYKLNPDYLGEANFIEVSPETKLFKKLKKRVDNRRAHDSRDLPDHLMSMWKQLKKLEFDYHGAEKWVEQYGTTDNQIYLNSSVESLRDKRRLYFKISKTNGRLNTNLTNLKKEMRQFIKGEYVNIDLANSQPYLLGQLLTTLTDNHKGALCCCFDGLDPFKYFGIKPIKAITKILQKVEIDENGGFKKYMSSVNTGTFYEVFASCYPGDITRDQAKNIILPVLYSRNFARGQNNRIFIPHEKEKKIFSEVFPFVYEATQLLKEKNHAELAIFLQKVESNIFIDQIAMKLVEAGIIPLTIHDSVIVHQDEADRSIEIMEEVFLNNFYSIPTFKVEPLKKK